MPRQAKRRKAMPKHVASQGDSRIPYGTFIHRTVTHRLLRIAGG